MRALSKWLLKDASEVVQAPDSGSAPARGSLRRALLASVLSVVAVLGLAGPASAEGWADGGFGGSLGFTSGGLNLASSTSAASWDLVDSGYDLSQLDVVSGMLTGNGFGDTLTADYTTQADLMATDMMALDAANLAEQSRKEAERRRIAALSSQGSRLVNVPDPYGPMVEAAIRDHCPAFPPSVLAAQIEAESQWNPKAKSPVGAQGIAQFMPGTWKGYATDGDGDGTADVWNPADAIPSAAKLNCANLKAVESIPGDQIDNALAAYNAGAGAVRRFKGVPPYAETQNYVKKIRTNAAKFESTEEGGDASGCPTSAPANTLRRGAESVGIAEICARAVASARNPAAAGAIKYMLNHVGLPYSQPKRNQAGYYDCSSMVTRAYTAAGVNLAPSGQNAPTTASMRGARWAVKIPTSELRPGDLFQPASGHVVMVLADGWMVHTNRTGDVSHVTKMYGGAGYWAAYVDASRV